MATLNTNSQPEPFGSNSAAASPDLAHQTFLGASLVDFSVSADWSSQGGKCVLKLVEDDSLGQKFLTPLIGSPQFFKLLDTGASTVFRFNGIVDSVFRSVSPNGGKVYTVTLSTPSKILGDVSMILDKYAGYGYGNEGVPRFMSVDGYYDVDNAPSGYIYTGGGGGGASSTAHPGFLNAGQVQFGTNNNGVNWNNYYNLLNIFGGFENESAGLKNMTFKGFGAADSNRDGIRFDKMCFAIHELVNNTQSADNQKYFGSNIVHGVDTYNICNPTFNIYYYGFDIYGFMSQVTPYLPYDFRIGSGPSMTLIDFVSQVCEAANLQFFIELHEVGFTSGSQTNYSNTAYGPYDGSTNILSVEQSWTNSVFGGVISIRVASKNSTATCARPFSSIAYGLIGLEVPDFGDYGTTSAVGIHPGLPPTVYLDPLDDDYTLVGTNASPPYGGKFPVATSADYQTGDSLSYHVNRATSMSVGVQATDGTSTKMVVGDFQSRIVAIPRDYIYHYWGDIVVIDGANNICTGGISSTSSRTIPVVTQQLPSNDLDDFILIDSQDVFSNMDVYGVAVAGIYLASLLEIRMAMTGFAQWEDYLRTFKAGKLYNINLFLGLSHNAAVSPFQDFINQDGDRGYLAESMIEGVGVAVTNSPTSSKTVLKNKKQAPRDPVTGSGLVPHDDTKAYKIYEKLHNKIKSIGDKHYGKSWYVPMPIGTSKLTTSSDNLIGNFTRSWDVTDSAYLEPLAFPKLEAPQSNAFISDGKLQAYANWEHSFFSDATNGKSGVYSDIFTSDVTTFKDNQKFAYDFSDFSPGSMVHSNICATGDNTTDVSLVHTSPSIDKNYKFLPHNYFQKYNRSLIPFNDINLGTFTYTVPLVSGQDPVNSGSQIHSSVFISGVSTPVVETPSEKIKARAAMETAITNLKALSYNDNGTSSFPFVRVTTGRVFHPFTSPEDYEINTIQRGNLLGRFLGDVSKNKAGSLTSDVNSHELSAWKAFPATIPPKTIGVPQRSNRFVYGPWISDYTLKSAGRVEYEQNDNLKPENYLLPVYGGYPSIPSYGPTIGSTLSGFQGMNLAGQAYANSIDNFDLFAEEQGTITLPGAPLIVTIADALLGGPLVTDISVSVKPDGLETTYNFRTYSPRVGRTNREMIKKLDKISNTIKFMSGGR